MLTSLVALPVIGGLLVLVLGKGRDGLARQLALAVSLVTFTLSLGLWARFDAALGRVT